MHKPTVIIYRDELLALSETFILSQAESLKEFTPLYVGMQTKNGLSVPEERRLLLERRGSLKTLLLGSAKQDVEKIRSFQPSLIHAHFGPDAAKAMMLARQLGVPLITTFHGYDINLKPAAMLAQDWKLGLYLARRHQLKRASTRILAVSHFIREKLVRNGFPPEKIEVHYIGVDTALFTPANDVHREETVLFVGRLVENKGCEYLLRAMKKIQERNIRAKTLIIGDGPLRSHLQSMATQLNLQNCIFMGAQPPQVVRECMNRARVFSVPSIEIKSGASEGFGLVFCEAQSMGLPVVSFKTGGIPEAVSEGNTGFLAPPGSVDEMADKIMLLLQFRDIWSNFSSIARKRVKRHFDLRSQSTKLEQIYSQVAAGAFERPNAYPVRQPEYLNAR